MSPAVIAALSTAIVSIIGAAAAAYVSIQSKKTMQAHIDSHTEAKQ